MGRTTRIEAVDDGLTITCEGDDIQHVMGVLTTLAATGPADAVALAASVHAKQGNKYDRCLDDPLLAEDYAIPSTPPPRTEPSCACQGLALRRTS
jgi:hypothetical protein